jgi:hypothetical protein
MEYETKAFFFLEKLQFYLAKCVVLSVILILSLLDFNFETKYE